MGLVFLLNTVCNSMTSFDLICFIVQKNKHDSYQTFDDATCVRVYEVGRQRVEDDEEEDNALVNCFCFVGCTVLLSGLSGTLYLQVADEEDGFDDEDDDDGMDVSFFR